ncbi:MAG: hypothetical protein AAF850_03740, partial [Pseudomonadota bacterium]
LSEQNAGCYCRDHAPGASNGYRHRIPKRLADRPDIAGLRCWALVNRSASLQYPAYPPVFLVSDDGSHWKRLARDRGNSSRRSARIAALPLTFVLRACDGLYYARVFVRRAGNHGGSPHDRL